MAHRERLDRRTVNAIPAGLSDAEIVRRVLGSEPALFEVLMRRDGMRSKTQDPEGRAADRELGRMLEEAVDEIPDAYRTVFGGPAAA